MEKSYDIPEDLWPEILSRLPVKSLLRFCSVSKSWLSLINHTDFCRLQLNQFSNNLDGTNLFVAEREYCFGGMTKPCIVKSDSDIVHSSEVPTPLQDSHGRMLLSTWWTFCSIDGLMLLQEIWKTEPIMLWNPSIRRVRILPTSPINAIYEEIRRVHFNFGFGFDPLIQDYKLVRLIDRGRRFKFFLVEVYTVGAGLWKTIEFRGKGLTEWCWSHEAHESKTVCFRGALYVILWNWNSGTHDLVSFDLSKEVFASTVLHVDCNNISTLVDDGGCSLRMIHLSSTQVAELSIWVLESSNSKADAPFMFWTKRYTFAQFPSVYDVHSYELRDAAILYLKKTGDMVLTSRRKRLMLLNVETRERKTLFEANGLIYDRVCEYKESLVLLKA